MISYKQFHRLTIYWQQQKNDNGFVALYLLFKPCDLATKEKLRLLVGCAAVRKKWGKFNRK